MILGIDPGLANVGWCLLLDDGTIHSHGHIHTERQARTGDAAKRLAWVMYELSTPLRVMASSQVLDRSIGVIEWPGGASGFQRDGAASGNARSAIQTSTTAGALYGALYWLLRGRTERILTPAPVTWRAALARSWGCQRSEQHIHNGLLSSHPDLRLLKKQARPHILDACGLAEYGRLMTKEGKPT